MADTALLDRPRQTPSDRPSPSAPPRRASPGIAVSLAALVTTAIATGSVGALVEDSGWWLLSMTVGLVVVGAASLARLRASSAWAAPVVSIVVALEGLAFVFANDTLLAGVVPTPQTFARFGELLDDAGLHIQSSAIPAPQNTGLDFVLVLGVLAAVVFVDTLAVTVRAPLVAAVPLLALAIVPGRVLARPGELLLVAVVIAGILLVMWLDRGRDVPGRNPLVAAGAAAAAIILGLVGQTLAPAFDDSAAPATSLQPVFSTGVDPLVRLGDNLRRGADVPVLTYRTDSSEPVYLRVVTISDLSGEEWSTAPLEEDPTGSRPLSAFPTPEGLADDVAREVVTTTVEDLSPTRRWLPVPYPAVEVDGLGAPEQWAWQPETLTVGTLAGAESTGEYTVQSLDVRPTVEQLRAAEGGRSSSSPDLALPDTIPAVIGDTARQIVSDAGATTAYDRAVALQDYFRGGQFRYDEDTPEVADGDGDSFDVIATFLADKRGYCVHFASAMAVMARTLDIPARIAVGYQPGERLAGQDGRYEVTAHDLHAWPELYFEGVGWTRFEPTPGRGDVPSYESNEPVPAAPSASAAPEPQPTASTPVREEDTTNDASSPAAGGLPAAVGAALFALAVLALLAVPAVLRRERRRRRLARAVDDPSGAWQELHDTAVDLRLAARDLSPRGLTAALAEALGPDAAPLAVWRVAAERARYADSAGPAVPPSEVGALRRAIARIEGSRPWPARAIAVLAPVSLLPSARSRIPASGH